MSKSTKDIKWVAGRIDWTILIFFIGLFVLIAGVVKSGLIVELAGIFPGFGEGETPTMLSLSVFTAILSNLFSNVPAVMLISEMMSVGDLSLWLVLAASSTLAGNATLIGSAANIIVAERSEEYGIKLNFFKFIIIGMIVTIVTIIIMILMMKLMFL
jgi:Na+/H+ antiporter NhaD/arsenite permease-like protein